jgi:hypothetical protein
MGANGARALAPIGASLLYRGLGTYESLFTLLAVVLGGVSLLVIMTDTSVVLHDADAAAEVMRGGD